MFCRFFIFFVVVYFSSVGWYLPGARSEEMQKLKTKIKTEKRFAMFQVVVCKWQKLVFFQGNVAPPLAIYNTPPKEKQPYIQWVMAKSEVRLLSVCHFKDFLSRKLMQKLVENMKSSTIRMEVKSITSWRQGWFF